jgi:hypothetical protein
VAGWEPRLKSKAVRARSVAHPFSQPVVLVEQIPLGGVAEEQTVIQTRSPQRPGNREIVQPDGNRWRIEGRMGEGEKALKSGGHDRRDATCSGLASSAGNFRDTTWRHARVPEGVRLWTDDEA